MISRYKRNAHGGKSSTTPLLPMSGGRSGVSRITDHYSVCLGTPRAHFLGELSPPFAAHVGPRQSPYTPTIYHYITETIVTIKLKAIIALNIGKHS